MFAYFRKSKSQKELFFQLNSSIAIEKAEKISGVYAIYKSDVCLYVGQSSNIPSRLATHLCGRYADADKIFIFENANDEDLILNEKYIIQKLKPVDNILVDYDEDIEIDSLFCYLQDLKNNEDINILDYYDFCIMNDKPNIFIFSADMQPELYTLRKSIKDLMIYPLIEGNRNA